MYYDMEYNLLCNGASYYIIIWMDIIIQFNRPLVGLQRAYYNNKYYLNCIRLYSGAAPFRSILAVGTIGGMEGVGFTIFTASRGVGVLSSVRR